MKRHAWKWGAVLAVLGLVLWLASRGAPETSSPGGPGASRDSSVGAGLGLHSLFQSAAPASRDSALRIRGRVKDARGPVVGARVFASAVVAGESLSVLPCGEEGASSSALTCYGAGRLAGLVTQRSGDAPVLAWATSEEEGSFWLEGLNAGHYSLWVESPAGAGVLHDVAAGEEGVELLLGEGVRVSGLVTNEENAPVAGALVTAIFTAHSRFFEAVTDGTGRFRLGPLPRGGYVLLVSKQGLLPQRMELAGYAGELERKVRLFHPRRISGQVVRADAPVAGARVSTWLHEEDSALEVLTDAAGRFSLEGLQPSRSYELIATRDALGAKTRVDFDTEEDAPRLLERTDITLELEPIVEVKGVVRDQAGQPIEGVIVTLWQGEGEDAESVSEEWTDAEGRYHVGPAAPGKLRIELSATAHVSPDDHEAVFQAGTSTVDFVLERMDEEEGEEAEGEHERAPSVVGEVVDELGAPVPHAEVTLWYQADAASAGGRMYAATVTDARGHFSLEASPHRRYRVAAEFSQDDVTHSASRVVELGKEDVRVRLRFERGQVVSGVVVDSRGQPLEGAMVSLRSTLRREFYHHGRLIRSAGSGQQTGPDGRFTFQSVSGEQLELFVSKPDYLLSCAKGEGGRHVSLAVKPGEQELRVVLVREAALHGQFVREDGSPIEAFAVNEQVEYDGEGRFSVPIRCTGTLELELIVADDVEVPGLRRVRRSVTVREEVDQDVGRIVLEGK